MNSEIYRQMARIEDSHWWFTGRRYIVSKALERLVKLKSGASILDAGCGTGGNLKLLQRFGNVVGMEMNQDAALIAGEKVPVPVVQGKLPYQTPFPEQCFNLIMLLDVLEHIEEDTEALKVLWRMLKPGGYILITVPAFSALWSKHDEIHHHQRRYSAAEVSRKMAESGFKPLYVSYYNFLLFHLIAPARILKTTFKPDKKYRDLNMPSYFINNMLKNIFSLEGSLIGRVIFPWGVSIIACAYKKP